MVRVLPYSAAVVFSKMKGPLREASRYTLESVADTVEILSILWSNWHMSLTLLRNLSMLTELMLLWFDFMEDELTSLPSMSSFRWLELCRGNHRLDL